MIYNGKLKQKHYFNFFCISCTAIGCLFMVNMTKEGAVANFIPEDASHYAVATVEEREIPTKPRVELSTKPTVRIESKRQEPGTEDNRPQEQNSGGTKSKIIHKGYSEDDYRQDIVNYAYKLGGMDLVILMECESGMNPEARGDSSKAFGLCQMNTNYHKLPKEYYTSRQTQVELCAQKRKSGTPFYGPDRYIKGVKCSEYVKSRFIK